MKKFYFFLSVLFFLISFGVSHAAITIDATSSAGSYVTGTNPVTWSHTVGSGSNRVLLVGYWSNDGTGAAHYCNVSAMTFDGVSLTKYDAYTGFNGNEEMCVWYLVNPPTGTHTISATLNSSVDGSEAYGFSYFGASQNTDPIGDATGTATLYNGGFNWFQDLQLNDPVSGSVPFIVGRKLAGGTLSTLGFLQVCSSGTNTCGNGTTTAMTANVTSTYTTTCSGCSLATYGVTLEPYAAPTTPQFDFAFPVNGTTTPDFQSWLFTINNVTTTDLYKDVVYYQPFGSLQTYSDYNLFNPTTGGAGLTIIPKSQSLSSLFNATTSWYAYSYLYDETAGHVLVASSSAATFTIENNGQFINVTTEGNIVVPQNINVLANPVQSVNHVCTAPTSSIFADPATYTSQSLAYGLCSVGVFMFYPSQTFTNGLQASYTNLTNVFPFSVFFGLSNIGSNSASGFSSDGSSTLSLAISSNWGALSSSTAQATATIATLSPNLFSNYFGSTFWLWYSSLILAMEWVVAALAIYKLIF